MIAFPVFLIAVDNDNDRQFLKKVYIAYRKIMYYQAYTLLRQDQDAEDVLAECWVSLCKHVDKLRELSEMSPNDLRRYLVRAVLNASKNYLLKKSRRQEIYIEQYDIFTDNIESNEPLAEDIIERDEARKEIKEKLRGLPENYYHILQMKYVDGFDDGQIAGYLQINKDSVRAYLSSARRKAKEMLLEIKG